MSSTEIALARPAAAAVETLSRRDRRLGKILLAPALAYIFVLVAIPFLLAVFLSLTNSSAGSLEFSFVGLQNFRSVLSSAVFLRALRNTFVFTLVSQGLVIVMGNILARALMKPFRGKLLVRFLILLPWAAPISLATLGWLWIFDSTFSVINWMLKVVGWLGPGQWYYWLGDPVLGMVAIITVHVWRMLPFSTVILLAGLTSIPKEIHEAARVDGAGFWRQHFRITLPLVRPALMVAIIFRLLDALRIFDLIYVLTPNSAATKTMSVISRENLFDFDKFAYGSAQSTFLFLMIAVMTGLYIWLGKVRFDGGDR